jgi:serine protease Do
MRGRVLGLLTASLWVLGGISWAEPVPAPAYCVGEYAQDLSAMAPKARELEGRPYSFCVRSTAIYECLSYAADGGVRRSRRTAVAHGTAFAYRRDGADTLLLTNEHVATWPSVTDQAHSVDGIPAGCKRVSENLRVVDNEEDRYESDDVALQRVVVDPRLDAAVLRTKTALPLLPWQIGKSSALHERDVVEVRGFPLGAFQATNVGKVISALQHDDEKEWDHDDFVIDALLSSGNSGSPVLAVSCRTGELELVGVYHAGYIQGSALNVVVGIDQLRELMTTLRRSSRKEAQHVASNEDAERTTLGRAVAAAHEPFFPLGGLTASARPRSDGVLVFQVFRRDFPFRTQPLFAFEDRPTSPANEEDRVWFGGSVGLKSYRRGELDADSRVLIAHATEALRSDALAFFNWRVGAERPAHSRSDFEQQARGERDLLRTVAGRRDLAASLSELAERLAPQSPEAGASVAELFAPSSAHEPAQGGASPPRSATAPYGTAQRAGP